MSVEILDGSFRERLEEFLATPQERLWLAAPFLTYPIARWLATLCGTKQGDRRLLISWASESLDADYLSARGVGLLRASGFAVRDLRNLHAKTIVAGTRAYVGSGNLTRYGLFGANTEIGVFTGGPPAAATAALFDEWWANAATLSAEQIHQATARQALLAKKRGRRTDTEVQPGHQPPPPSQSKRSGPQYWIKSQHYRPASWTIAPGQEHWISDPGERDKQGGRVYRKDGVPAGKPSYRIGDIIGLYFGTTLKVPVVVEVVALPEFAPEFVQVNNEGGEPDAGERWPWMTKVLGRYRASIDHAPDIDYLNVRGPILWGRPHFRISPAQYQMLIDALRS